MNHGELTITVWPPYIGVASGDPSPGPVPAHEPYGDVNYARGMITWRTNPDGTVVGRAEIFAPKGIWTHLVFCSGPHQEALMGQNSFEQPIIFDRPGIIEIDPIQNRDVLPREAV